MERVPRISGVEPVGAAILRVRFDNGEERMYDCHEILSFPRFHLLRTAAFFRAVRVDPGGYGISWNDNMDLSEYELWTHGRPVAHKTVEATG